jgi:hypothetical protein
VAAPHSADAAFVITRYLLSFYAGSGSPSLPKMEAKAHANTRLFGVVVVGDKVMLTSPQTAAMSPSEALAHCINELGWKNACIPSGRLRENLRLDEKTVYEYEPKDFFDTPRAFFFGNPTKF